MSENKNRRKFIKEAISALAISSLAIPAFAETKPKGKMIKMLTSEGKLVEVDESVLNKFQKKKANNKDIVNWVKPKS
jgi:hypothetical protein